RHQRIIIERGVVWIVRPMHIGVATIGAVYLPAKDAKAGCFTDGSVGFDDRPQRLPEHVLWQRHIEELQQGCGEVHRLYQGVATRAGSRTAGVVNEQWFYCHGIVEWR